MKENGVTMDNDIFNNMSFVEKAIYISNNYTLENQTSKTIEELMELKTALERHNLDDIVTELADVEIMLTQIREMFDIPEYEINATINYKLSRQFRRIAQASKIKHV